jgi:hypothetical protein
MAEQDRTKKRKRTTIYIHPQHWQMVGDIAEKTRRTKTETLEIAIERLYDEHEP